MDFRLSWHLYIFVTVSQDQGLDSLLCNKLIIRVESRQIDSVEAHSKGKTGKQLPTLTHIHWPTFTTYSFLL